MSSKLQRIGILIIAFVFVVSTIGIGVFYVLQAQQDSKNAKIQADLQKQLTEQTKPKSGENMIKEQN